MDQGELLADHAQAQLQRAETAVEGQVGDHRLAREGTDPRGEGEVGAEGKPVHYFGSHVVLHQMVEVAKMSDQKPLVTVGAREEEVVRGGHADQPVSKSQTQFDGRRFESRVERQSILDTLHRLGEGLVGDLLDGSQLGCPFG
jgi:hypothetical protein